MKEHSLTFAENEIVFKASDLLWSVLKCWRSILAVMLIAGVLIGGAGFIKSYKTYKDPELRVQKQQEYEEALGQYELSAELYQTRIQNLENLIQDMDNYSETSLLLLMDPYNVYRVTQIYYIDTNYEIMPDVYFQNPDYTEVLVKSYRAAIERLDFDSLIELPGEADLTTKHPILDKIGKKIYTTSVDVSNGLLTIRIISDTEQRAKQILSAIDATVQEQKEVLNAAIGEHTVSVLSQGAETIIDVDLVDLQNTFSTEYESTLNSLTNAEKKLADLQKPSEPTYDRMSVIKDGIKYGFLGMVAGLFVTVAYYVLTLIARDVLTNTEGIRSRYRQPVLGTIKLSEKRKSRFDFFVAEKLGFLSKQSKEEAVDYILENIRLYQKELDKVLIVSSLGEDTVNAICALLAEKVQTIQFIAGGNINLSSEALKALSENIPVIVTEELQKSEHLNIVHEMDKIAAAGSDFVGFIVTY